MILVVIYNLSTVDYQPGNPEKLENAITQKVLSHGGQIGLTQRNVFYSFPKDPTITSDDIPIIISIKYIPDTAEVSESKIEKVSDKLVNEIPEVVVRTVNMWRKKDLKELVVIVESDGKSIASHCFADKGD